MRLLLNFFNIPSSSSNEGVLEFLISISQEEEEKHDGRIVNGNNIVGLREKHVVVVHESHVVG